MPGQFRPRGVTMRDCSKSRAGFDRVLMAVAATFLTVSATSALAQTDPARNSAAELAIDAAIPRPEPANVPPPTVNDFKPDASSPTPPRPAPAPAKMTEKAAETKPSDVVAAPAADTGKPDDRQGRTGKAELGRANLPRTTPPTTTGRRRAHPAAGRRCRNAGRRSRSQGCQQRARRPISRSPTNCATCWAQNPRAISTARPNGLRWRSFTPRATLRRCGPRAAR